MNRIIEGKVLQLGNEAKDFAFSPERSLRNFQMAIIGPGSTCAICRQLLTKPIFATSHFISDESHDLWRFSDAAMHWECYANWEHQKRFASLYFVAKCSYAVNKYWCVLWKSDDVFVLYGIIVDEISVLLKESGWDLRILRDERSDWVQWKWLQDCNHPIEAAAVEKAMPQLKELLIPQPPSS